MEKTEVKSNAENGIPGNARYNQLEQLLKTVKEVFEELNKLLIDQDVGSACKLISETRSLLEAVPEPKKLSSDEIADILAKNNEDNYHGISLERCPSNLIVSARDLKIQLSLAVQPLRDENSTLRRKLRISNQKLKNLEHVSSTINDSSPLIVQALRIVNENLQKELNSEKTKNEKLIQLFSNDEKFTKNQQVNNNVDRIGDQAAEDIKKQISLLEKQILMYKNDGLHKDKEIIRLKRLAMKLQEGMQELLNSVNQKNDNSLPPKFAKLRMPSHSKDAQSELGEQQDNKHLSNEIANDDLKHSANRSEYGNSITSIGQSTHMTKDELTLDAKNLDDHIKELEENLRSARVTCESMFLKRL